MVRAGRQAITAADPIPDDLCQALDAINRPNRLAQLPKLAAGQQPGQRGQDRPVNGELMSLRLIYLHMIEEYARHIGHADFLREQIDGATGE
jgi:hypothetical protein